MRDVVVLCAKCGFADDCMPFSGVTWSTVCYKENGEIKWLSLADCDGIPSFYISDMDLSPIIVNFSEENGEKLNEYYVDSIGRIPLTDYYETFEYIRGHKKSNYSQLVKYAVYLACFKEYEGERFCEPIIDKPAKELDIPPIENEYD